MARFVATITVPDAAARELYGEPMDAEGLQTALEAALGNLEAEVEVREDDTAADADNPLL